MNIKNKPLGPNCQGVNIVKDSFKVSIPTDNIMDFLNEIEQSHTQLTENFQKLKNDLEGTYYPNILEALETVVNDQFLILDTKLPEIRRSIGSLEDSLTNTNSRLEGVSDTVDGHGASIETLDGRVTTLESSGGGTGGTGGTSEMKGSPVYYGTCDTASATTNKIVKCEGFVLEQGATILIKFTNYNKYNGATLNVNNTGAIKVKNTTTISIACTWDNGSVVSFTYDGTNWVPNTPLIASSTYYGVIKAPKLNGASDTEPIFYAPTYAGQKGSILKSNGTGAPDWDDVWELVFNGNSMGEYIFDGGAYNFLIVLEIPILQTIHHFYTTNADLKLKFNLDGLGEEECVSTTITPLENLEFSVMYGNGNVDNEDNTDYTYFEIINDAGYVIRQIYRMQLPYESPFFESEDSGPPVEGE